MNYRSRLIAGTAGAAAAVMLLGIVPTAVNADMNIEVGEYIEMGEYYGKPILWRCVDIDENGPLILSDKILCFKAFDASGDNTSGSHGRGYREYYDRKEYGSNYWGDSNIRDWLNSESTYVTWSCGNKPDRENLRYNVYDKEAGFLTNFTQSEKNTMRSVTQKSLLDGYEYDSYNKNENYHRYSSDICDVLQNYDTAYSEQVTDKIFLLDVKQVNSVYNNNLGNYYTAYPTQECVDNSEYKDSSLSVSSKCSYWLRSPACYYDDSHYVRCVWGGGGIVDYSNADISGSIGVRPAFYLNLSSSRKKSGDGTEYNPYKIDTETEAPTETPRPTESPIPTLNPNVTMPTESPTPTEAPRPTESPSPTETPSPTENPYVSPSYKPQMTIEDILGDVRYIEMHWVNESWVKR